MDGVGGRRDGGGEGARKGRVAVRLRTKEELQNYGHNKTTTTPETTKQEDFRQPPAHARFTHVHSRTRQFGECHHTHNNSHSTTAVSRSTRTLTGHAITSVFTHGTLSGSHTYIHTYIHDCTQDLGPLVVDSGACSRVVQYTMHECSGLALVLNLSRSFFDIFVLIHFTVCV